MPLPSDMLESALQEIVTIAGNFSVHSWESDAEMRSQNMMLFGKVASALLNRREVVDRFSQAAAQVSGTRLGLARDSPGTRPWRQGAYSRQPRQMGRLLGYSFETA